MRSGLPCRTGIILFLCWENVEEAGNRISVRDTKSVPLLIEIVQYYRSSVELSPMILHGSFSGQTFVTHLALYK